LERRDGQANHTDCCNGVLLWEFKYVDKKLQLEALGVDLMDPFDVALAGLPDEYLKTITGNKLGTATTETGEVFYFNAHIATQELLRRKSS
jgi:hypothetical protein